MCSKLILAPREGTMTDSGKEILGYLGAISVPPGGSVSLNISAGLSCRLQVAGLVHCG